MSRKRLMWMSAGLAAIACALYAADAGGTALLPKDSTPLLKLSGSPGESAKVSNTAVKGQPFASALRVEVATKPQRATDVQVTVPVDAALASGDVLLLTFWMRSATPGGASIDTAFRTVGGGAPPGGGPPPAGRGAGAPGAPRGGGAPGAPGAPGAAPGAPGAPGRAAGAFGGFGGGRGGSPLNMPAMAGAAWKKIQYPFALTRAYNKGEAELAFTIGGRQQTVEIGGVELATFGTTKKVADLPFTKLGYGGSEPTAAWRKAAVERIEKNRKGDLTVTVKDAAGKPVRNAEVTVRMKKHAFLWGTTVSGTGLSTNRLGDNLPKYKQQITELFNFSVMENEMKWPQWSVESSRPATIANVDWLRENGVLVRGHNLVWPSWRNTNVKAAEDARGNPTALAKVITDHITETTKTFAGKLVDWDVINETFTNHDLMDILGKHAMVDWFQTARAADPKVKLYINDFNIVEGEDKPHQDDYAETIKYLIDQGAQFDGIGLQSHFPARLTPMDELFRRLDRFAAFGKELEITEFDIDTSDEATQADYTRDFMTAVFSYPSVKAFVMWGFWEGSHWRPRGAMLRRDWSLKPNAEAYKDLVFKKWWTNTSGKTNGQGTFAARGFLGDYEVEAKANGKSKVCKVSLPKEGAKVDCVLD